MKKLKLFKRLTYLEPYYIRSIRNVGVITPYLSGTY